MLYAEKMPWALSNRKNSSATPSNATPSNGNNNNNNTDSIIPSPETPSNGEQIQIKTPNITVIDTTANNNNNGSEPVTPVENRSNLKLDGNDVIQQPRRVYLLLFIYLFLLFK